MATDVAIALRRYIVKQSAGGSFALALKRRYLGGGA